MITLKIDGIVTPLTIIDSDVVTPLTIINSDIDVGSVDIDIITQLLTEKERLEYQQPNNNMRYSLLFDTTKGVANIIGKSVELVYIHNNKEYPLNIEIGYVYKINDIPDIPDKNLKFQVVKYYIRYKSIMSLITNNNQPLTDNKYLNDYLYLYMSKINDLYNQSIYHIKHRPYMLLDSNKVLINQIVELTDDLSLLVNCDSIKIDSDKELLQSIINEVYPYTLSDNVEFLNIKRLSNTSDTDVVSSHSIINSLKKANAIIVIDDLLNKKVHDNPEFRHVNARDLFFKLLINFHSLNIIKYDFKPNVHKWITSLNTDNYYKDYYSMIVNYGLIINCSIV